MGREPYRLLDERRVLVTGGASGIGLATVARFRADNGRVAVLDSDEKRLAAVHADVSFRAAVTREADVAEAVDRAAGALGGLDVLVTCAGVGASGTVLETPLERWERIFAVNVRGTFLAARAAIPHLRRAGSGAIATVAPQFGIVVAGSAACCASKGAVVQLTRAMAVDHAVDGIRVNCVCPGRATRRCSRRTSRAARTRKRNAGERSRRSSTIAWSRPRRSLTRSRTSQRPAPDRR